MERSDRDASFILKGAPHGNARKAFKKNKNRSELEIDTEIYPISPKNAQEDYEMGVVGFLTTFK